MPPPPPSKSYMLVIVDSSDEGGDDHHQHDEHDESAVLVPPPHVVSPPSPHAAAAATTTTTTLPTGSPSWMDRIAASLNLSASTSASTGNGAHSPSSSSTSEAKKLTSSEVAWMARCRGETPFSAMPHPLANGSRNQHDLQEDDDDYDHYDEIEEEEDSNLPQHTNSNNNNNNSKACKSKKKKSKKSKKKKRKGTAVGHSKGRDDVAAAAATTPNGTTLPAAKFAKQQQQRRVSFGHVHVRVHGRTLGSDVVPLHGGWPLGLDYDACLVQTKTQNAASTVHQKAVVTASTKNSADKGALVQLVTPPPVVTIQLPSPTVDQYEAAKQLRLQERWMEWNHHGNHNKGKASFPSSDDSDSASIVLLPPTTYLETRQWDFKSCSKNPLFGILAERERMMLLLAYGESRLAAHPPEQQPSSSSRTHSHMRGRNSSLSSTASIHSHNSVEEPVNNNNNNNSSSKNCSERVESDAMRFLEFFGSFDAPSPPPGSSSSSSSHDKSSSSSNANTIKRSNNTNTRRGRSNSTSGGSNNNGNNSTSGSGGERYNALFDKVTVHHVRNELEKIRTARSTHTGCTCRKLQMPAPTANNSNINSSSKRLKLSKVQTELRKRHLLPITPTSREELELLLYNTIQAEPCCTNYDGDGDAAACPCLRHGIECQADACNCWKSVVITTSPTTATTTTPTTTATMVSDIQTTCGNPYGMYVVDLDRVDAYRRQQLATTCKTMWTKTTTTTTTSDPTTTTTTAVGGGCGGGGSNSTTIDPMTWCMEIDTNNINNHKNDVSSMSSTMTVVPVMSPPSPRPVAAMTMAITTST